MKSVELRVLCEGATEYNFVVQVLGPHLRQRSIHAKPQDLGGVKSFKHLRDAIKAEVGRSRPHQFVTTMLDLYALPDYPGDPRAEGLKGAERALRIEAAMARELPAANFLPYIQVHEFEAFIFVDLELLEAAFPDGEARGAPERLRRAVASLAPEDIDDGPATAPSKRLIGAVPAYAWAKSIVGPGIAARVTLPRLRAACPHFASWIERLEQLAQKLA